MTATDPIGDLFQQRAERALAAALAPLIDRLAVLDEPRPGVWKPAEAAVVLGVSENTVRRWVRDGDLDRLPGVETVLIPRIAVDRFLDAQMREQAS